jgi:hypothetical protein
MPRRTIEVKDSQGKTHKAIITTSTPPVVQTTGGPIVGSSSVSIELEDGNALRPLKNKKFEHWTTGEIFTTDDPHVP